MSRAISSLSADRAAPARLGIDRRLLAASALFLAVIAAEAAVVLLSAPDLHAIAEVCAGT